MSALPLPAILNPIRENDYIWVISPAVNYYQPKLVRINNVHRRDIAPFSLSLNNPIPCIPFPLIRGRGIGCLREAKPLFDSLSIYLPKQGCLSGEDWRGEAPLKLSLSPKILGEFRGGFAPSLICNPPFPCKGRGLGGWVAKNLFNLLYKQLYS